MSRLIINTHTDKLTLDDKSINVVKEVERIAWGGITGDLVDQTDLNLLLENKADNDDIDTLNIALDSVISDLDNLSNEVGTKANAAAVVQALSTKADLIDGIIPASQLPSYVDDVLIFSTWADFPISGEAGKIYVTEDMNKTYRWAGSSYVVIADGVVLGETATTAYRGDRGKAAYDHSLSQGNPHNATTSDISEGSKLYFTENRVRESTLAGLPTKQASSVVSTDTLLNAIAKLQAQVNAEKVEWVTYTGDINERIIAHNIQFANIKGLFWIKGWFRCTNMPSTQDLFILTDELWLLREYFHDTGGYGNVNMATVDVATPAGMRSLYIKRYREALKATFSLSIGTIDSNLYCYIQLTCLGELANP